MAAADAARVRRDHPIWQAIINLRHGKYASTRLLMAARFGELARVETLIAWHADVNAADNRGWTALMWASRNGHVDVARALLKAGADVNAGENHVGPALYIAGERAQVEVVRVLLAAEGVHMDAMNMSG